MPAEAAFAIMAALGAVSAGAAMFLRNPVHCALSLVIAFAALAGVYLQLRAEFVGLSQILVYAGAVAILIVFAILLTRSSEVSSGFPDLSRSWIAGLLVAGVVFACLARAVFKSTLSQATPATPSPLAPVRAIGQQLLGDYVLPLEVLGLLLTAALVGAVLIAMKEKDE
jgi:NADH-quinone oxidoreductase subunit J